MLYPLQRCRILSRPDVMKNPPLIPLLLLGGAAWYLMEGEKFRKQYRLSFFGVSIDKDATRAAAYRRLVFTVKLRLDNPTDLAGTIKAVRLRFSWKGAPIGEVYDSGPQRIAAKSTSIVEVPVSIQPADVAANAADLVREFIRRGKIDLNVKGSVMTGAGTLYLNNNFPVSL